MGRPPLVLSTVAAGHADGDGAAPRECPYMPAAAQTPARSMYELFRLGVEATGGAARCMGHRGHAGSDAYVWYSYEEVDAFVRAIGGAICGELGVSGGDRVGVFGKNCPAWAVVQMACSAAGAVLVPFYDTIGGDAVKSVACHAGVEVVFVEEGCWEAWRDVWRECPSVRTAIVFCRGDVADLGSVGNNAVEEGEGRVLPLASLMDERLSRGKLVEDPDLEDLCLIMYTSGTTGMPKGVQHTNKALVTSVAAVQLFLSHWEIPLDSEDVFLSFLPLAHIFAQQTEALVFSTGAAVAYYGGDVRRLLDDLALARPTLFAAVPRVYARFQERIMAGVESAGPARRALFRYAYASQLFNVQNGRPRSRLWDALVFNKIRNRLLPQLKIAVTGAAPMSMETNDFLKVCLNGPVVQGFGMTETVAGVAVSVPNKGESGACGGPVPGASIKLVSVPEMGYLTQNTPPRGEVFVSGPMITSGYYKDPEATAVAFPDGDGWMATGDIGQWNPNGSLQIIDRRKNLFKISQGEYVSPESLEAEYAKAKLVFQIWVYGSSFQSSLLAVVVPDISAALAWAGGRYGGTLQSIAKEPEFKAELLKQLTDIRKGNKAIKGYEAIRDCIIETEGINELGQGFNVSNGCMTPSLKLRRVALAAKYKETLDALYSKMEAKSGK